MSCFSATPGNVIFANVAASRRLAQALNELRGSESDPERVVHAGALFAMGLIDELNHALVASYRKQIDPAVFSQALQWFAAQAKPEDLEKLLLQFTAEFPNTAIFRGELSAARVAQRLNGRPSQSRSRAGRADDAVAREYQSCLQPLSRIV